MQEMQDIWVLLLGQGDPWSRKWQPAPVFLPGEFHGQRSLVGCSPPGRKESDMTERLTHTHIYIWREREERLLLLLLAVTE